MQALVQLQTLSELTIETAPMSYVPWVLPNFHGLKHLCLISVVSLWPREVAPHLTGLVEKLLALPEMSSLRLSRLYFGSSEDLTPSPIYTTIEYDKH